MMITTDPRAALLALCEYRFERHLKVAASRAVARTNPLSVVVTYRGVGDRFENDDECITSEFAD